MTSTFLQAALLALRTHLPRLVGLGSALALGVGLGAGALAASAAPWWLLAGGLLLGVAAQPWRLWRSRTAAGQPAAADAPAVRGLQALDEHMLGRLGDAVVASEVSTLRTIQRVTGLRDLSSQLMAYLGRAQEQSVRMQQEIERNGAIVGELASFVQQLPTQIADERAQGDQLVAEVRELATVTETIRGMARQTEILAINAAIAAARAGDAGRGFAVLAGEVRRLAQQSNAAAQGIEQHIGRLVQSVQGRSAGEFAQRQRHNEQEAARLLTLTARLDEGYLDMRQFYAMLLTAITGHNSALDDGITDLLEVGQQHDVFKQVVDRLTPAFAQRRDVLEALVERLRAGQPDCAQLDAQALALATDYAAAEQAHHDPDACTPIDADQPTGPRIEMF